MERLLGPVVWLCCVWSVAKAIPRGAQIAASILDTATGRAVKPYYYVGKYGEHSLKAEDEFHDPVAMAFMVKLVESQGACFRCTVCSAEDSLYLHHYDRFSEGKSSVEKKMRMDCNQPHQHLILLL